MDQFEDLSQQEKAVAVPAYIKLQRVCFAVCIILGPLAFLLYAIFDPTGRTGATAIAANVTANAITNQLHLLFGVVASLCLPFGFLGMALLAMRRTPWLGTICILLAVPSWVPLSAFIALDALTYDMAQMGGGTILTALWERFNGDGVMLSYLIIYGTCHLVASVLLGIALGRGRIIPIWAATALVLSAPLTIVIFPLTAIAARKHLTFIPFIFNLNLIVVLLLIGSIPAAWAILKLSRKEGTATTINVQ